MTEAVALSKWWPFWLNAHSRAGAAQIEALGVARERRGMIGLDRGRLIVPVWACPWGAQPGIDCGCGVLRAMLVVDPMAPQDPPGLAWGGASMAPWEPPAGEGELYWPRGAPMPIARTLMDALRDPVALVILNWRMASTKIPADAELLPADVRHARELAGDLRRVYGTDRPRVLVKAPQS